MGKRGLGRGLKRDEERDKTIKNCGKMPHKEIIDFKWMRLKISIAILLNNFKSGGRV